MVVKALLKREKKRTPFNLYSLKVTGKVLGTAKFLSTSIGKQLWLAIFDEAKNISIGMMREGPKKYGNLMEIWQVHKSEICQVFH